MAEMQNTGNPLGSNDLKDLNDNLIVLDRQLNSEELTTTDRFGNVIPTVAGMRKTMEDLASQIATNELVPTDGSRSADKLSLKDSDSSLVLKAESGELKVGDKTALVASTVDDVKTVDEPTNFTGALQQNGSGVVTKATALTDLTPYMLGAEQTWKDVKDSRSINVIYTNTGSKPIQVYVMAATTGNVAVSMTIDGVSLVFGWTPGGSASVTYMSVIIPPGSNYKLNSNGVSSIYSWNELS